MGFFYGVPNGAPRSFLVLACEDELQKIQAPKGGSLPACKSSATVLLLSSVISNFYAAFRVFQRRPHALTQLL